MVIVLVLIMVAAVLYAILSKREPEIVISGVLPDQTAALVRVKNLEDIWAGITSSQFWRELRESAVWKESGLDERLEVLSRNIKEETGFALSRHNLMELFGRDLELALIEPASAEGELSLVIFTRVGLQARVLEVLGRLGSRWRAVEDRSLTEEEYAGQKMITIRPTDSFPFFAAYSFLGRYLVVTLSPGDARSLLREMIDRSRGQKRSGSLAENADYLTFQKLSLGPANAGEFFLRIDRLLQSIKSDWRLADIVGSPTLAAAAEKWKEKMGERLENIKTLAGEFILADGLRGRISMEVDRKKLVKIYGEDFLTLWNQVPQPWTVIGFIPSDPLLTVTYQADFQLLWKAVQTDWERLPDSRSRQALAAIRAWESSSGVDLQKDIFPGLGGEVLMLLEGINPANLLPVPELAGVFTISDPERIKKNLEKIGIWLTAEYSLPLRKETYSGVEITSFSIPVLIKPAYAIMDDFLVISSSLSLVKKMIDVKKGEEAGIRSNDDFRRVSGVLGTGSTEFMYLDGNRFLNFILQTGDWWVGMMKMVAPEKRRIDDDIYRRKIVPFIKLLKVCKAAGMKSWKRGNIAIQDFYWYIQDLEEESAESKN